MSTSETFKKYINQYYCTNGENRTHTRIPSTKDNITGGSYSVPEDKFEEFYTKYYNDIYKQRKDEYLTECHLPDDHEIDGKKINGPILIDFDFRYDETIQTRQHSEKDIEEIIAIYLNEIKLIYDFTNDSQFEIFVCEKPNVNIKPDEHLTKDGIHMIIAIQMAHQHQLYLREKVKNKLYTDVFSRLNIKNDIEGILDIAITKGATNWQLYGSKKPGNEAYRLTYIYDIKFDMSDKEFMMNKRPFSINKIIPYVLFKKLLARYKEHPQYPIKPNMLPILNSGHGPGGIIKKRNTSNPRSSSAHMMVGDITWTKNYKFLDVPNIYYSIRNEEELNYAVGLMIEKLKTLRETKDHNDLIEIHEYTQLLPEQYYKPGSHLENRKIAFALKNAHEDMFISWIKLRSKASDFDYKTIGKLYNDWTLYFNNNDNGDMITKKTIKYLAHLHAPTEYERINNNSLNYYLQLNVLTLDFPEFNMALLLHKLYEDTIKYTHVKAHVGIWYIFEQKNHKWVTDESGSVISTIISTRIVKLFKSLLQQYFDEKQKLENSIRNNGGSSSANAIETPLENLGYLNILDLKNKYDEMYNYKSNSKRKNGGTSDDTSDETEDDNDNMSVSSVVPLGVLKLNKKTKEQLNYLNNKISMTLKIINKLGKHAYKIAVIKECSHLFIDQSFEQNRDENKYLLGFRNGVYDLQNKEFRNGRPEDNITLSTNINYIDLAPSKNAEHAKMVKEINEIIGKIYTDTSLCQYMWEHWASCLCGVNYSQTIHFYLGNGSNGKSIITNILQLAFGEYCDKTTIQLITCARVKLGSASPELANLKGRRIIYMSEPDCGEALKDGNVKEYTGDATIQVRGLYNNAKSLSIQCKFIACMNNLLKVNSMDDGIWRRLRVCPHDTKFTEKENINQAILEGNKIVFEKNEELETKIAQYAEYFMSMLIDIFKKTNGHLITSCDLVKMASSNYKNKQDLIHEYIMDKIIITNNKGDMIKRAEFNTDFEMWLRDNYLDYNSKNGKDKLIAKSERWGELLKRMKINKTYTFLGNKDATILYGIKFNIEMDDTVEVE